MKLTVSLFGKLRIFSDFIEPIHRAGFGEELREWLLGGSRSDEILSDPRLAFRLAWPRPEARRLLAAVLWASSDSVGRSCPFALFSEIPPRKLKVRSLAEWPLSLAAVWDGLEEIAAADSGRRWVELEANQSAPLDIQAAVRAARLRVSPRKGWVDTLEEDLARWPARDFLAALLGPEGEDRFASLAWRLAEAARSLPEDEDPTLALRLPAARGFPVESVAGFWLEVIAGLAEHRLEKPPVMALPAAAAHDRGILILFRDLIGADFDLLFGRGEQHRYLVDLLGEGGAPAGGTRARGAAPAAGAAPVAGAAPAAGAGPAADARPEAREAFTARCRDGVVAAGSALDIARLPLRQWMQEVSLQRRV